MEPYKYFLPHVSQASGIAASETPIETLRPVFSHTFDDIDTSDFHGVCECKEPNCITGNGKSILFSMKKWDKTILYKSYHMVSNEFVLSKKRTLVLDGDWEHRLYDYNEEICFLFRSELVVSQGEGFTNIHVSYMILDEGHEWKLVKDVITLEYSHFFNKYYCFLCTEKKKLVVLTGHYKYGFKKSHNELCDTHLDVLSYNVERQNLTVEICANNKRNVTEVCRQFVGNYINRVFFTLCGTKLFLVSSKEYFVLSYSLTDDTFGPMYEWDGSLRDADWYSYFYAYHKDVQNILLITEGNGTVTVLKENNLTFQTLAEKGFSLTDLGYPFERFDFFIIDYHFDDLMLYILTETSGVLLVVDCFRKQVVGKYEPPDGCHVLDITANWSGEEVFLFSNTPTGGFDFSVIYINKKHSLKDIALLAVLQIYSVEDLKNMNLPKMIKQGIFERIYQ